MRKGYFLGLECFRETASGRKRKVWVAYMTLERKLGWDARDTFSVLVVFRSVSGIS